MKLRELLAAVPEAGLELLNNHADLDRVVTGMDTGEPPDVALYIKTNSLVLTTAMVYRENQEGLVNLIVDLDKAKVAGLAIKLGRFIDELDQRVLEKADELRFPLLRIPITSTLGVVADMLQAHLMGSKTKQFHYALDIQEKISQAMFRNASLQTLLRDFSELLSCPVLYYDYFFDPITSGVFESKNLILTDSRILEVGNLLREEYKRTPFTDTEELLLRSSFGDIRCICTPVIAGKQYPFFLVILHAEKILEPFSFLVTKLVGGIFSFSTHNQRQILENEWRASEEFFYCIVNKERHHDGHVANIKKMIPWMQFADILSFMKEKNLQVIAVGYRTDELPEEFTGRDHFELIYRWLKKTTLLNNDSGLILPLISSEMFLLILRIKAEGLLPLLESVAARLKKILPLDLRFGIGNPSQGIDSFQYAYLEATSALARALADNGPV
jgi:purine catabolism regulator